MALSLSTVKKIYKIDPNSAGIFCGKITYDNRNNLRSGIYNNGDLILIEFLGLFRFHTDNTTEVDDDETCFVINGLGAWLLECPHYDFIDCNTSLEEYDQFERIEDLESKFLTASTTSSITSVAAVSSASFTITVTGATTNDFVSVSPNSALPANISLYYYISAANTVTVVLNNPSAAAASVANGILWKALVYKA